jgi:hypothetical protein
MRKPLWLFLAATPVLAQQTPTEFPKLHPLEINVHEFNFRDFSVRQHQAMAMKRACAIPLLTAAPKPTAPMPVIKPSKNMAAMPQIAGPAPACETPKP